MLKNTDNNKFAKLALFLGILTWIALIIDLVVRHSLNPISHVLFVVINTLIAIFATWAGLVSRNDVRGSFGFIAGVMYLANLIFAIGKLISP